MSNLDAELYDLYVSDWRGEIDFYLSMAQQAQVNGGAVLEMACGTGRVAIRLAQAGIYVTGLDHSVAMLDIARSKSARLNNINWVQADMRDFKLDQQFGLAIMPGHAFQNIHTSADQTACLTCIRDHLAPDGRLAVHLDHQEVDWLGDIWQRPFEDVEYGEKLTHPTTGQTYRMVYSWAYERSTQTAIFKKAWELLGTDDVVLERHDNQPIRLHCVFRGEMEHAAHRAGFEVEAVYGDFLRNELNDDSAEMIWVLKRG